MRKNLYQINDEGIMKRFSSGDEVLPPNANKTNTDTLLREDTVVSDRQRRILCMIIRYKDKCKLRIELISIDLDRHILDKFFLF